MIDFIVFQQVFFDSLFGAKEAYEKANQMDLQNDGENFSYEIAHKTAFDYVLANKNGEVGDLHSLPMKGFIESLLELAKTNSLPDPETMLGENKENPARDFAKKTFLLITANSIMEG